jgi:hypothetical protein
MLDGFVLDVFRYVYDDKTVRLWKDNSNLLFCDCSRR